MNRDKNKPAYYLDNLTLSNDWEVKGRVLKLEEFEKCEFAITYIVEREGKTAILKALDFSIALQDDNPVEALRKLTAKYEFEKDLMELCKDQKLSNIVKILDHGVVKPFENGVIPVPYIILEYSSDNVNSQIKEDSYLNLVWLLKILHNTTKGLFQLHKLNIAVTNLKPEHIKAFSNDLYKLSELGTAEIKGKQTPYKDYDLIEEPIFMPPERLYGYRDPDWKFRFQAADLYSLGSVIFFLFTQTATNGWLFYYLDESHKWENWNGTYEEVLPYLIEAYDKAIYHFIAYIEDNEIKTQFESLIRSLCHPDPKKRGHYRDPSDVKLGPLALERYLSDFDLLYNKAIVKMKKIS